ncbi:SDR family oxidoreductase [Psychrobacter sp. JB385]|uniref:SDR family NAD(P)-dependent oxidoreductase n=1 Tax=Psychrobacter sp. JB385 TaxID=1434841 RepID=UPI00097E98E7|nr:SDR family NAD(P)-dependent oxidoreductase [Psychrobacter sp. JB385]SJN33031.1 Oxidoreductase, short-chain dehydrogenase/reductase family [Psychrobacter sp. JB385]
MIDGVDCSYANTSSIPHLVVVGGTSGIGLALARRHQMHGWRVSVVGHNPEKIKMLNQSHPDITTYACDLTDAVELEKLLQQLSEVCFQRLIYSAGSYFNERIHTLGRVQSDQMLAINLQAFEHIFCWASAQLKRQVEKQPVTCPATYTVSDATLGLICMASIAGVLDYPYASLYAKSKRAMIATASAYRCALQPYGIQVTCIASGYIDTQALRDLNEGDASHKPFIMSTEHAVDHIMQAISEDTELAIFPWTMRYITRILNRLPKPILHQILRNKLDRQ